MHTGTKDLTKGNITLQLLSFFLPIAAGNVFHQFYNMVDTIVVGQFVSSQAIAAVGGSSANLANFYMFISNGLLSGSSVVIAQRFGAGDHDGVRRAANTAVTATLLYGAVTTILLLFVTPQLLVFMHTPEDVFADSLLYLRTYFSGSLFVVFYCVGSNILRAVGDSRRPFIYLLASCLTNIFLDLLLVIVFELGVFGVAIATVFSQLLSAVLVTLRLVSAHDSYAVRPRDLSITGPFLRHMLALGVPAMLQSAMYNVANMMVQISVNRLGSVTMAAWSLTGKVDGYLFSITSAAGVALINFVGQNYGAGDLFRIKRGVRNSIMIFVGFTFLFCGAVWLTGPHIFHLFTTDLALMYRTWNILKLFLPFYFLWTFVEIYSAALRGIGDAVVPVIICALGIAAFRVFWLTIIVPQNRIISVIALCFPISWGITMVSMGVRFYTSRRLKAVEARLSPQTSGASTEGKGVFTEQG